MVFKTLDEIGHALDGTLLASQEDVLALIDSAANREPFMGEIDSEKGDILTVGIGKCCYASVGPREGGSPFFDAVSSSRNVKGKYCTFLLGGTLTEIPSKYCLTRSELLVIIARFVEEGVKHDSIQWEQIA
jgi:hypothetical protein